MNIQEIIDQLRALEPAERRQLQAALAALSSEPAGPNAVEAKLRRAEEAWRRLEQGWCTTGGKNLSESIDEALDRGGA